MSKSKSVAGVSSEKRAPKKRSGAKKSTGAEICYGCGATAQPEQFDLTQRRIIPEAQHPVIGIINTNDLDDDAYVIDHPTSEAGPDGQYYVGVPVCRACHVDPQHRRLHDLKVHFFERQGNSHKVALMMAGSNSIGA